MSPGVSLRKRNVAIASALFATILGGCTTLEKQEADQREQLLSAAGFTTHIADTPQKLAALQVMKQRKVIRREKDGQVRYVFADAQFCHCLFVGKESNYQEFEKLSIEQEIAEDDRESALDNSLDGQWAYDSWSSLVY